MDFPVNLHVPTLRPTNGTLFGIARTLVDNMSGTVETGILDATQTPPFTQDYLVVQGVKIQASPTANRQQSIQNGPGVVALLDDALGIRPTVILPEGLVSVDWDKGNTFLCVLSGNRQPAFYMTHSEPGMEIEILLSNTGTNQVVGIWDPAIVWSMGVVPVMPPASPGGAAVLQVSIINLNGVMYGEFLNFPSVPPIFSL